MLRTELERTVETSALPAEVTGIVAQCASLNYRVIDPT